MTGKQGDNLSEEARRKGGEHSHDASHKTNSGKNAPESESGRGFAGMSKEKREEAARKGGQH